MFVRVCTGIRIIPCLYTACDQLGVLRHPSGTSGELEDMKADVFVT